MPCDCRVGLPNGTSVGLRLASDLGASITGLGLIPEFPVPELVAPHAAGVPIPPAVTEQQKEETEETRKRAKRTNAYFSELADLGKVPFHWKEMEDLPDRLAESAARMARLFDLTIVDQKPGEGTESWTATVERIILGSGRPTLVVPETVPRMEIGARAVIGWDNSSGASRAVHDAIPLLKESDAVRVVTVLDDGDDSEDAARQRKNAAILAEHLGHHGILAATREIDRKSNAVGAALLEHSVNAGADLLVVGGYGQAGWREAVFGSLTRKLLSESTIPVLISH